MKKILHFILLFISMHSFAQNNTTCATATPLTLTVGQSIQVSADYTNVQATQNNQNCNIVGSPQSQKRLWYSFTMPVYGNIIISTTGNADFTLFGSCTFDAISCFQGSGYFYTLSAGTYYLEVAVDQTFNGIITFSIEPVPVTNDTCDTAQIITVPTVNYLVVDADTRGSSLDIDITPCENQFVDFWHNIWYKFTMPVNGNIRITNAGFGEIYSLYDSCNGGYIYCFESSRLFTSLTANQTYYLKVSQPNYIAYNHTFRIQAFETVNNDDCANATSINVTTTSSTTVNVNTNGATYNYPSSSCENSNDDYVDQWFTFTMPVDGNIRITNAFTDDVFTLFNSCNAPAVECFSGNGLFYSLTAGITYTLKISNSTFFARTGAFNIQAYETVANNDCVNAEPIVVTSSSTTTVNVNTNGATESGVGSSCEFSFNTYVDQWFTFTMPVNGNIKITNSDSNDVFTLYDSCNGNEISCRSGNGLIHNLFSGTTYILKFSNRDVFAKTGSFDIQAFETVVNDICVDAINLNIGTYNEYTEYKTLSGLTASGVLPLPNCAYHPNTTVDAWFKVQVPNSGKLTIETTESLGSSLSDTVLQAFTGTCNSLTEIACDNNSGSNFFSRIELSGLTPNQTIYIRVFENGSDVADFFGIFAYDNNCISATNWDGTSWSYGIPDNTKIAVIDANYDTNLGDIDACMCKISRNKNILVRSNHYIKIENNFYNYGIINIEHQGSFVQVDDNAQQLGTGTYEITISTTQLEDENRFTYFSSPVQFQTLDVFNSWAKMNYIWDFDANIQDWHHLNGNETMPALKGFAVEPSASNTFPFVASTTFTGKFNNGVYSTDLVYNPGGIDDDNVLVGNPYPSAVDATMLLNQNPGANAFYFWTHKSALGQNGYLGDDYAIWNNSGGIASASGSPAPTGYIASGQGFFVTAIANGTITFNNAMRTTTNNNDFRRPDNNSDKIWINLTSDDGNFSQTLIAFIPQGTDGFDPTYDATRLNSGANVVAYSIGQNNEHFGIDARAKLNGEKVLNYGIEIQNTTNATFTIAIDHLENFENATVFLKDNLLNVVHDLKQSDYTFTTNNSGEINTRFELWFNRSALSVNENTNEPTNIIIANTNDNQITVQTNDDSIIKRVKVYDILGKLLVQQSVKGNTSTTINLNVNEGTILFVNTLLEDNTIITKKIVSK